MRGRAAIACAGISLGLLTTPPATAAPVALAGQTTITSASAGQTLVRVPRTVNLPGQCNKATGVSVRGTAKFAAVVLSPTPYREGMPNVILGRLPDGRTFDTLCAMGARPLPAGTYTLTVVHTPGTAAVTLTLPGLSGRLSLARFRPVRASAAILPRFTTPADVSKSAGGWGTEGELAGPGMTATVTWLEGSVDAALYGDCNYGPGVRENVPREIRYAPGCAAGDSATSWAVRASGVFFSAASIGIPAGRYGLGSWYTAPVGSVVTGGAVGLWVPFT